MQQVPNRLILPLSLLVYLSLLIFKKYSHRLFLDFIDSHGQIVVFLLRIFLQVELFDQCVIKEALFLSVVKKALVHVLVAVCEKNDREFISERIPRVLRVLPLPGFQFVDKKIEEALNCPAEGPLELRGILIIHGDSDRHSEWLVFGSSTRVFQFIKYTILPYGCFTVCTPDS
jgi:hypothetical protein